MKDLINGLIALLLMGIVIAVVVTLAIVGGPIAKYEAIYCQVQGCPEGSTQEVVSRDIYHESQMGCPNQLEINTRDVPSYRVIIQVFEVFYIKEGTCQVWQYQ